MLIADIIQATAKHYGVSVRAILSPERNAESVQARHSAMYLARTISGHSYPTIARAFRRKDHTTVMHAVDKVSARFAHHKADLAQVLERLG